MSIAGILAALCTLTSEPQHADAAVGSGHRASPPIVKREVRPATIPAGVVGRVVDALGNAVANVTVVATPGYIGAATAVRPAPRARTDRAGRFRFLELPPGEYVFVTIHGDHASSVSPAMPVDRRHSRGLEVVLIVGGTVVSA